MLHFRRKGCDQTESLTYGVYLAHNKDHLPSNMATMHVHQTHELYFLITGHRRYFVGHSIYDVLPGNLMLIPATQLHRTTALNRTGYERYVLNFSEETHQFFLDLIGDSAFRQLMESGCLQLPAGAIQQIQQYLEQMEAELAAPGPYTKATVIHLLHGILLTALRWGRPKPPFQGDSADKIQAVTRYVSEHFADPMSLHDAAQMAYMEDTYFSKRFKALTGFGFHEYLTRIRLRAAETLLRETQLSMGEIAERCGFSGSNYFGDIFRRWNGIAPSEYRRLQQED